MTRQPIRKLLGLFLVLVLLVTSSGCQVTTAISSLGRQATTPSITQETIPAPKPKPPPTQTQPPITTTNPTPVQTTQPPSVSSNGSLVEALVTRVIDGDTIEVSVGGKLYTVRYIGMDTPETVDPNKPVQPYGIEASDKNKELVGGKTVRLEKDVSETDRYGRLLRYVYVGNLFVNAELVRIGYAQVATYPPDVKYQDLFLKLQIEARTANRGLWGLATLSSTPNKTAPTTATTAPVATPNTTGTPVTSQGLFLDIQPVPPVGRGYTAILQAKTLPGADCTIAVYYASGKSTAAGLTPAKANNQGDVSWSWKVGTTTTLGSWRIVVTATSGGKTITQETYFTVR